VKIDLPNGAWASLRDPEEIPRKLAKGFRRALFDVAGPLADTDTSGMTEDEAAGVIGKAMLQSGDALGTMEGLSEAMILAVVEDWSYGPVDAETMDAMPDAAFSILDKKCGEIGYFEKLTPNFSADPDPDSPTSP